MALRSLYESYKESTKYLFEWLSSEIRTTSSQPYVRLQTSRDIINAALIVQGKGISVPSSVIAKLADAIRKRREVLTVYRNVPGSSNEGNARHEAFIDRLQQVFDILSPLKATAVPSVRSAGKQKTPKPICVNHFDSLRLDDANVEEKDPNIEVATAEEVISDAAAPPADTVLEDDDLGQWIEMSVLIYEMDTILEYVDRYWEDAAKGHMPITLAAALSTVALHAVDRISTRHAQLAPNATAFIDKWMTLKSKHPKIRFTDMPDLTCQSGGRLDDQRAFHHVHQVIHHKRTMDEYRTISPNAGAAVSPSKYIRRFRPGITSDEPHPEGDDPRPGFDEDDWALDGMQESMCELLHTKRAIAGLEAMQEGPSQNDNYVCEPLLPFMRRITTDPSSPIPIALGFGMEMLLSSFKAFMWPDYMLNKTNCRIKVLKFARDVKEEMETTAEAIDSNTNSKDPLIIYGLFLSERAYNLDQLIKEKRFDLYYQALWTAGSHMAEILDVARYEGGAFCFRTGYLCTVLHVYNALRAVAEPISAMPALERLCCAFKDSVFLGTLPSENFSSHYRRAKGNKFARDRETGRVDYRKLSRASQREQDHPPPHLSLFSELHNDCYQTTSSFWMKVYSTGTTVRSTRPQEESVMNELHSRPFNIALDKIKEVMLPNFQDDLSLARLNFLAISRFCLKFLNEFGAMARKQTTTKGDPTDITDAYLGFLYIDNLLESIVEHLREANRTLFNSNTGG